VAAAREAPDAVASASRWLPGGRFEGYGRIKLWLNLAFQKLMALAFAAPVTDFTFGYRLYPRRLLERIRWRETYHPFVLESLLVPLLLGVRVVERPAIWRSRTEGVSSWPAVGYAWYLATATRIRLGGDGPETPGGLITVAAVLGFLLGALFWAGPVYSVEIAQVVAGVVVLPPDHPLYAHHVAALSPVMVQLPALLLRAGVPAPWLCVALAGLTAALSCAAVTACAWAWSRDRLTALAAPALLLGVYYAGHKYPLLYPAGEHDTGIAGMAAALLALSLAALGPSRLAAAAVGFLPAVHPTLAIAAGVGFCCAWAGRPAAERRAWLRLWPWFLTGAAGLAAGWAVNAALAPPPAQLLPANAAEVRALVYSMMASVDYHRASQALLAEPWRLLVFLEVDLWWLALVVALRVAGRPTAPERFLMDASLGWTALAVAITVADEAAPALLPLPVKMLIAPRWLNLNVLLFMVAVIGSLGALSRAGHRAAGALLVALAAAVLLRLVRQPSLVTWMPPDPAEPVAWTLLGAAFPLAAVAAVAMRAAGTPRHDEVPAADGHRRAAVLLGALALLSAARLSVARGLPEWSADGILGTAPDRPVFAAARAGTGALFVAPGVVSYPQLRTGRPVVVDTALVDILPYAPGAAPAFEKILGEVYGASLLAPAGRDLFLATQSLWAGRTPADWARLGARHGATQVLAPAGWRIDLPEVARSARYALHAVPATVGTAPAGAP
jgi:hypothetical protein